MIISLFFFPFFRVIYQIVFLRYYVSLISILNHWCWNLLCMTRRQLLRYSLMLLLGLHVATVSCRATSSMNIKKKIKRFMMNSLGQIWDYKTILRIQFAYWFRKTAFNVVHILVEEIIICWCNKELYHKLIKS